MRNKVLRLTVVSALAFCLVIGLGILPALADSGGGGGIVAATKVVSTAAVKASGAPAPVAVAPAAPSAKSVVNNAVNAAPAAHAAVPVVASSDDPPTSTEREDEVEFAGTIQSITGSLWTVNGISFTVNITTQIRPSATLAVVGAFVEVEAIRLADGSLVARKIEVVRSPEGERERRVEFRGIIESFNANVWVVSGRTVNISTTTQIRGTPAVSATAEVEAVLKPDGSLWALKIEVEQREVEKERVEFKGIISAFDATQWVVGGRTVLISTTTQISGTPQIGLIAEVQALKVGATLTALRIRVLTPQPREIEIEGKITSISGTTWVVDGKTVNLDANTQIDQSRGVAKVGAQVDVKGLLLLDGTIQAKRIRVEGR